MLNYLPEEVVIEILSRAPVKSLLCCRCVCKSWNCIIASPKFISAHLKQSTILSGDDSFLALRYLSSVGKGLWLYRNNEQFDLHLQLELPFKCRTWKLAFVGSCNGVICLLLDHKHYIGYPILWNPSIRRYHRPPRPTIPCPMSNNFYGCVLGFGLDSGNNDCKVVRIVNVRRRMITDKAHRYPIEVELYSLNAGSWRKIDANLDPFAMVCGGLSQALLNGVVHWVVCRIVDGQEENSILTFDLKSESFGDIFLPKSLAADSEDLTLSVFEKALNLFDIDDDCCDVWVMKQYGQTESWAKKFTIDLQGIIQRPLLYRKNGEILMEMSIEFLIDQLVSYHIQEQRLVDLAIPGFSGFCSAEFYMESLVLLGNSKSDEEISRKRKERCLVITEMGSQVEMKGTTNETMMHHPSDVVSMRDKEVSLKMMDEDQETQREQQLVIEPTEEVANLETLEKATVVETGPSNGSVANISAVCITHSMKSLAGHTGG
uniref:F-box domain-containing protein n=1 Tax=Rhizophora mucronata TaxID=61149 RepID=A0A2P2JWR4_RHIMU